MSLHLKAYRFRSSTAICYCSDIDLDFQPAIFPLSNITVSTDLAPRPDVFAVTSYLAHLDNSSSDSWQTQIKIKKHLLAVEIKS